MCIFSKILYFFLDTISKLWSSILKNSVKHTDNQYMGYLSLEYRKSYKPYFSYYARASVKHL